MFGLGKLVGGALNAVGLGKIAPFVSMAINAATGNYAALATDVMGLMSNIKGLGFLNKVAQFAPLGGFGGATGGFAGGIGSFLSSGRLGDLASSLGRLSTTFRTFSESFTKINNALRIVDELFQNRALLQQSRANSNTGCYGLLR